MRTELEFLHGDLYGEAIQSCKKFVSKRDKRPTLKYALHRKDGDLIATDSFSMIHIKNIHGYKDDLLVNPNTQMMAKGEFPETDKLFSKEGYEKVITINFHQIKVWLQVFKSLNQMMKTMKFTFKSACMKFKDGAIQVVIGPSGQKICIDLPFDDYEKSEKLDDISFNVELMRNALEAHYKMNSATLNLYFASKLRPIILDDENKVKTMILPVRTY